MTNAKRRKLWRARVADYRASGLTVRAWCKKNGVTDNQLRYWLARIDEDSCVSEGCEPESGMEGSAWARVEIVEDASAVDSMNGRSVCSVGSQLSVRVGSAAIDVRSGLDPKLLADVLRVLLVVSKAEQVATC
jgi:transposase-like protein